MLGKASATVPDRGRLPNPDSWLPWRLQLTSCKSTLYVQSDHKKKKKKTQKHCKKMATQTEIRICRQCQMHTTSPSRPKQPRPNMHAHTRNRSRERHLSGPRCQALAVDSGPRIRPPESRVGEQEQEANLKPARQVSGQQGRTGKVVIRSPALQGIFGRASTYSVWISNICMHVTKAPASSPSFAKRFGCPKNSALLENTWQRRFWTRTRGLYKLYLHVHVCTCLYPLGSAYTREKKEKGGVSLRP